MPLIGEYAKRFGVYDELPNYLSYALGAGETTVMRMVTAYSMFANGGRRVKPTLIDRIQDRYGHTIFKHDERECRGCDAPDGWKNQPEPQLVDRREQVLDPMTAYQITSMMEGVVQAGTATVVTRSRQADRRQDRHHQRREGRLVHRLLAGPRGRHLCRLRQAAQSRQGRHRRPSRRADRQGLPEARARRQAGGAVPVPAGIKLIRVDAKSGMRAGPGDGGRTILEAFKPGTAPPDNYSVIGVADADGRPAARCRRPTPAAIMRPGTGGLY